MTALNRNQDTLVLVMPSSAPVTGNRANTGRGWLTGTVSAGTEDGTTVNSMGGQAGGKEGGKGGGKESGTIVSTIDGGSVGGTITISVGVSIPVRCFREIGVALGTDGSGEGLLISGIIGVLVGTGTIAVLVGAIIGVLFGTGMIGVAVAGSGLGVIFARTVAKVDGTNTANTSSSSRSNSATRIRKILFMFGIHPHEPLA